MGWGLGLGRGEVEEVEGLQVKGGAKVENVEGLWVREGLKGRMWRGYG